MTKVNGPLALIILDGWGMCDQVKGNAIKNAQTPNMNNYFNLYPNTVLSCSGEDVGLPAGQMGNSEVGHLNIGAGRVVYQELTRVSKAVRDGDFFANEVLLKALKHSLNNNSSLHLMGLLSDGGVHSHIEHLFALLELARRHNIKKVFIHCFLDGRDVPPNNAAGYIKQLEEKTSEIGVGKIATVMGRYYAMDRDQRWDRINLAYQAMAEGKGLVVNRAEAAVSESYQRGELDEFVLPTVVQDEFGNPIGTVKSGDSVIFFNFRPDRARQITRAFVDMEFTGFPRSNRPENLYFVCMTQYDLNINAPVAFKPQILQNTLGEVLSKKGIKQLRLAETEKYAHVTFFFNGGVEASNPGEERILVPSPKVATYDHKPEMSAAEVTEEFIGQLESNQFKVMVVNYANPDMVGHTGNMQATIKAIETVDYCLGRAIDRVLEKDGAVIISADHGNAECMQDEEGNTVTAHTTLPVPFILIGHKYKNCRLRAGSLEDVAPTMLELLGLEKPVEMTGSSLILGNCPL